MGEKILSGGQTGVDRAALSTVPDFPTNLAPTGSETAQNG